MALRFVVTAPTAEAAGQVSALKLGDRAVGGGVWVADLAGRQADDDFLDVIARVRKGDVDREVAVRARLRARGLRAGLDAERVGRRRPDQGDQPGRGQREQGSAPHPIDPLASSGQSGAVLHPWTSSQFR